MTEAAKPFAFSQLVPGFDFLKSLTGAAGGGTVPGLPSLSNWVAPTLSVEELEKRIGELKTVQFWLEQNVGALKATVQALEVQKMTLSTLRGMNVRMEDLANAFTRSTASAAAALREAADAGPEAAPPAEAPAHGTADGADDVTAAAAAPAPQAGGKAAPKAARKAAQDPQTAAPGVVDPLQWWGALTQQFQQIASNALQDAAQMRMPTEPGASGTTESATPPARRAAPARKRAAARKAGAAKRKAPGAGSS